MKSKSLIRPTLLFVFVGFLFSLLLLLFIIKVNSNPSFNDQMHITPIASAKNINASLLSEQIKLSVPVRLKIPEINVDATIESVGLATDGAVDVPKNQNDVVWFNLGPRPGEKGNAVIAGHYGWKDKNASVFDNLYKLRQGDKIFVEDDQGMVTVFVVKSNRRYNANTDAQDVFVSDDSKAHLNLITCEGEWNKNDKGYTARLVVFTDKE